MYFRFKMFSPFLHLIKLQHGQPCMVNRFSDLVLEYFGSNDSKKDKYLRSTLQFPTQYYLIDNINGLELGNGL